MVDDKDKTREELREEEDTVVVPTKGDGRGNDVHGSKTGEFKEKESSGLEDLLFSEDEMKEREESTGLEDLLFSEINEQYTQPNPNDIISLKNFDKAQERVRKANPHLGNRITDEEERAIKEHVDPMLRKALLGCNFQWADILNIINSNHIYNQFSLGGKSGGWSGDPKSERNARAMFSHQIFGSEEVIPSLNPELSIEQILKNRQDLEKYGCLMDNNPLEAIKNRLGSGYGGTFFIMNDDIKDRVTFTIGDSLNGHYDLDNLEFGSRSIPQRLFDGFDKMQYYGYSKGVDRILSARNIHELTNAFGVSYIEAQMHGEVRVDRDIYGCCARPTDWESAIGQKALPQLLSMGIRCFTRRGMNDYMEEITINDDGYLEYRRIEKW